MRVATVKKTSAAVKNHAVFFIEISWKIDQKSMEKLRKSNVATQIDKKSLSQDNCWSKKKFYFIFGPPRGPKNDPKSTPPSP